MVRYGRAMEMVRNSYAHAIRTDQLDTFLAKDSATTRLAIAYYGPPSFSDSPFNNEGSTLTRASTASGWYSSNQGGYWDATLKNSDISAIDLANLPDLHDNNAIGFEPGVGWVTSKDNLERDTLVRDLATFAFVAGFSYVTGGIASGEQHLAAHQVAQFQEP